MLTNKSVRCVYCNKSSFFYVHSWKGRSYAAIYTECPKCKKYADVYHFAIDEYDKILRDVLAGKIL